MENRGKIQTYYCKNCKKRFIGDNGFLRMRNNPNKIIQATHMYFSGVSLRKTQEHLGVFHEHNVSHMSVLRWIRKYMTQISKFTNKLNLKVGHELMRSRTIQNLVNVLSNVRKKTGNQVSVITTDGLQGYPKVLKKTFGLKTHWNHKSRITHNIVIAFERGFNHKIERLHNSIRERTKIFRGFGNLESAKAIMKGYEIYYNFLRKHQAISKYPYELVTELKLRNNKLLSLIKLNIPNI